MSTNKYKWLTLGLTTIVISGCSVGNRTNLNLGIADAFQKSKSYLHKKKLAYQAPATGTNFGYATPVASSPVASSFPTHASPVTVVPVESAPSSSCGCGCSNGSCGSSVPTPVTEFYMPTNTSTILSEEVVNPPVEFDSGQPLPAALPLEESQGEPELENPLPAEIEVPDTPVTPSIDIAPTEEEGIIETLDSAAIDLEEDFISTPEKDEASILDTASKPLKIQTPTSAGESVVEQRSKMLTLTARPVQSNQKPEHINDQSQKVEMRQVTHKRHFRHQNALRPLHRKFRSEALEHTAEAPGPLKFKGLPVMPHEASQRKTSDANTGAPPLNQSSNLKALDQSTFKVQRLPSPPKKIESETDEGSVIKTARLPILKAESTSSAAIGSLRNFTNVRDLDPGFDKGYYARKKAETASLKGVQVIADEASESSDDLLIR